MGGAAEVLAALSPAFVVSSDARRAVTTAAVLGQRCRLQPITDPRLREIDLGGWQGRTREDVRRSFPDEYRAWVEGRDIRRGGGETYAEVGTRAAGAIYAHLAGIADRDVLVAVTHGGTVRAALGTLLDLPVALWWRLGPLGNCRWSILLETTRGWRLVEHNGGDPPVGDGGDDR